MSLHIAILYGSVHEARAGIRVVRFLEAALHRQGNEIGPRCTILSRLALWCT